MKKKVSKIIFIVSFFPYIIILVLSLYVGIFGHEIYNISGESFIKNGLDAFLHFFMDLFYIYCIWVPILPIVAIYQAMYIVITKIRKK